MVIIIMANLNRPILLSLNYVHPTAPLQLYPYSTPLRA
jgi:hypothetical protein